MIAAMSRPLPRLAVLALVAGCTVQSTTPPDENPCDPNPCNQVQHRTVCVAEGANSRCLCEEGFMSRPSGVCESVNDANCPSHAGDAAEPDDCSARAKSFSTTDSQRAQSISPVGDVDFFKVPATTGHVYEVTLSTEGQTSLVPRVDLFDRGGIHLDWAEPVGTLGLSQVQLFFKAYTTAEHYLRVSHSPVDWSVANGDYIISIRDAGADVHGDGDASATSIAADPAGTQTPAVRIGRFDFPADHDWFSFSGDSNSYYQLTFVDDQGAPLNSQAAPIVRIADVNGVAQLWTPGQRFRVATSGKAHLELVRSNGGVTTYRFVFTYSNIP